MAAQATDLNIQQLEVIEQQISSALQSASSALSELSRDKPSIRQVENHSTAYMKAIDAIEDGLSTHINYLTQCSTGQPHEGSCYAAQNDLHMSHFRWEHVRSRLQELEKMKNDHIRQTNLQRSMSQSVKRNVSGQTQPQQQPQPPTQPPSSVQQGVQPMDTGGIQFGDHGSA